MSSQRASQLVEAGLWLRLSGDHEGARRLFEQALRLDPGNARAKQLLEQKSQAASPPAPPAVPPVAPVIPPVAPMSSPTIPFAGAPTPPTKPTQNPFQRPADDELG